MPYSGMLDRNDLGSTVQLMETGDWGGLRRFVERYPEFARRRGGTISELLYRYACGTRDSGFRNLNIYQLGILLSLNKVGAQINRRRTLVSYVARFEPDRECGGYFVDFPDIYRIDVTAIEEGENLREAEINARHLLANYVAFCLRFERDLPKPSYSIRKNLKKIKQCRVSVNFDDLVKAERSP